jgi:hypothetical protein
MANHARCRLEGLGEALRSFAVVLQQMQRHALCRLGAYPG